MSNSALKYWLHPIVHYSTMKSNVSMSSSKTIAPFFGLNVTYSSMWDTEISSSATPFGRAHLRSSLLTMGLVQIERQHHRMHLLCCGISTNLASKFQVNREEREPWAHATSNVNVFYICIYRNILPMQKRIHCFWNCRSGGYKTVLQFGSPTAITIYKRCSRSSAQACVTQVVWWNYLQCFAQLSQPLIWCHWQGLIVPQLFEWK